MHEFIFILVLIVGIQTNPQCIGILLSCFQNTEVSSLSFITTTYRT